MLLAARMYLAMVSAISGDNRSRKEDGAAMVEYGLLVVFIAVVALVAVKALGVNVSSLFNNIAF